VDSRLRKLIRKYRTSPSDEIARQIANMLTNLIPNLKTISDMDVAACHLPDQEWYYHPTLAMLGMENLPFENVHQNIDEWIRENASFEGVGHYEYILDIRKYQEYPGLFEHIPEELTSSIKEAIENGFEWICYYIA